MKELKQKTVLITGAAGGIGFCTAKMFARAGAIVILTDINVKELTRAKKELKEIHENIYSYVLDVSNKILVDTVVTKVIKKFKKLDILINNAGLGYTGELAETSFDTWKKLMDVNFWGVLNMTYAFLPHMKKKEDGHIINVSSGQAFFRLPTWGAYASVKLAMACFSEVLYYEIKKHNIDVTTVYPFMVDTGFYDEADPETWGGKLSMRLVPYYSMKPEAVAKIIFDSVEKTRKVERVSFLNDLAFYGRVVPFFSDSISRIASYVLTKNKDD
ncbi:MAG: SDR family oxidoreductase [bacterium]|nr:SDR family oxidoreductase [bacterium]MBU1918995.1 SDR family oxidoreductase [bacterium]